MSRKTARALTLGAALCSVIALTAAPAMAQAPDFGFSRSSGTSADASWTETDPITTGVSPLGNTHVGFLSAEPRSKSAPVVWGFVEDFDCDPGELPYGGHGEPGTEGLCDYMGARFLEGTSNMVLTMDRKFSSAHLTGNLIVSTGHDGTQLAMPPVDITWTASGSLTKMTTTERYVDEYGVFTQRMTTSARAATVTGYIGAMNFTDDADDISQGQMGSYRVTDRYRSN